MGEKGGDHFLYSFLEFFFFFRLDNTQNVGCVRLTT